MHGHSDFPFSASPAALLVEEVLGGSEAAARREPAETWTLRVRGWAPKRLSDGCVKAMPFTLHDDPRTGCDDASRLLALLSEGRDAA